MNLYDLLAGNILIKRMGKQNVYVKLWQTCADANGQKDSNNNRGDNHCVSDEIVKHYGVLQIEKSVKLFDMDKFLANVSKELKNSYPNRRQLESQCVSCVAFVQDCHNVLELPIWLMIINIVALDLLKMKLPVALNGNVGVPNLSLDFDLHNCHHICNLKYLNNQKDSHHDVDHTKCSANKLTIRRWRSLLPPFMVPILPPRDHERDENIKKLKEELNEVRIKIGNIGKG